MQTTFLTTRDASEHGSDNQTDIGKPGGLANGRSHNTMDRTAGISEVQSSMVYAHRAVTTATSSYLRGIFLGSRELSGLQLKG